MRRGGCALRRALATPVAIAQAPPPDVEDTGLVARVADRIAPAQGRSGRDARLLSRP